RRTRRCSLAQCDERQSRFQPDADARMPPAAQVRTARRPRDGHRLEKCAGARTRCGSLLGLQSRAYAIGARGGARMGRRQYPSQYAASECGIRHRDLERGSYGGARGAIRAYRRAVQAQQCIEDGSHQPRRCSTRRRDVRPVVRQEHRGADSHRRRQRARHLMAEFQSKFDTLRWRGGRLEMIDQRVLPGDIRYLAYDSAAAVAAGIRDMVVRGAPAIGCAAAYGIALEALRLQRHSAEEFNAGLDSAFSVLAGSRPTAVNLFWALARMRGVWEAHRDIAPGQSAERLLEAAHAILAADVAANRRMGSYGAELVADGASILTHCNAGALATAGHGTALGVIRSAIEA